MGIALSSSGYETPEQVLRDADTAMYQSKTHRRADFTIFEPAMHARAVERLRLETDLRRAIERQEFVPYYQAILSVKEKCIIGYEALARWQHPERGLVPPANFIPMAEETGMIVAIDRLILRQACVQMKKWLDRFRDNDLNFVSVNLAHKQILQPDLVEHIALVLEETGLPPAHLKLEITESVLFENPESALTLLSRLRGLGVHLYIDDFGTGYSSLSYLHRLPINGLKIDRSFIKRIDDVGENHAIIRTIMTLARDLNIDAVAEGVETANQLAHISSLDCAYWQGFLFSKPVKSEEAQALIE
jgi:EAL domain-containing protein (putative c-di-GMP-specific phosphodiesterase class I)